jgi:hypothetical protein
MSLVLLLLFCSANVHLCGNCPEQRTVNPWEFQAGNETSSLWSLYSSIVDHWHLGVDKMAYTYYVYKIAEKTTLSLSLSHSVSLLSPSQTGRLFFRKPSSGGTYWFLLQRTCGNTASCKYILTSKDLDGISSLWKQTSVSEIAGCFYSWPGNIIKDSSNISHRLHQGDYYITKLAIFCDGFVAMYIYCILWIF